MIIRPGGQPCTCGNRGCWERYGSATALIRLTREEMERSRDSVLWQLCGGDPAKVQGRTAFQAAGQGDPASKRVLESYLQGLSVGLINLVNVLQPEIICLGGGVSNAEERPAAGPPARAGGAGRLSTSCAHPAGAGRPGQRRRRGGRRPAVQDGVSFGKRGGAAPSCGAIPTGPALFSDPGREFSSSAESSDFLFYFSPEFAIITRWTLQIRTGGHYGSDLKNCGRRLARRCPALELREEEPMSRHTSFHVGRPRRR